MLKTIKLSFLTILIFGLAQNNYSQLVGVGYTTKIPTKYKVDRNFDSIYVYNAGETEFNTVKGSLKAVTPDLKKDWTIYLSKFNVDSSSFILIDSTSNDSIIVRNNLSDGGYQVRMKNDSLDTTFRAWIFINKLRVHLKKTDEGNIPDFDCTCEYVELGVISKSNTRYDSTLRYYHNDIQVYNPLTGKPDTLIKNNVTVVWNASPAITSFPLTIKDKIQYRLYDPPAENTTFTFNFVDMFGNSATDKVLYKTIVAKADFKFEVADSVSKKNVPISYNDEKEGEAPLHTRFINSSKHAIKFEWQLVDSLCSFNKDSGIFYTADSTDSVTYVYYCPRTYKVKLVATSPEGCIDTSEVQEIKVHDSKLGDNGDKAFPNYFTPGEATNNYFIIKSDYYESIRKLQLVIFNQWGKKIYSYEGPLQSGWKGWDGKINGNRDAVPGIYYYYYKAVGWGKFPSTDPQKEPSYVKDGNGFVYILRRK